MMLKNKMTDTNLGFFTLLLQKKGFDVETTDPTFYIEGFKENTSIQISEFDGIKNLEFCISIYRGETFYTTINTNCILEVLDIIDKLL